MKKLILALTMCLFLTGCSWWAKPGPTITDKPITIDARAYEACEPLRPLTDPDRLLEHDLYLMEMYGKCLNKQNTSIKIIKDFTNYKEPK